MMVVPLLFMSQPALPSHQTVVVSEGPKASGGSATVSFGMA